MTNADDASWRHIRPHVLGIARREGRDHDGDGERILVARYEDPAAGIFYRPPGGDIEFGEPSASVTSDGEEADFVAEWRALDAFGAGGPPLYPEGLPALLRGETCHLVSRDDVDAG